MDNFVEVKAGKDMLRISKELSGENKSRDWMSDKITDPR